MSSLIRLFVTELRKTSQGHCDVMCLENALSFKSADEMPRKRFPSSANESTVAPTVALRIACFKHHAATM